MNESSLCSILEDQTRRALWEVKNVMDCIPDKGWDAPYAQMPMWKHVYHMLHSLDRWFINPRGLDFREPDFHEPDLNNLDVPAHKRLTRQQLEQYLDQTSDKVLEYIAQLKDNSLLEYPPHSEYTRFTLMLGQLRHLHTHMGMLMGFLVADENRWPYVLGLEHDIPQGTYPKYF